MVEAKLKSVLIVEDDSIIRETLQDILDFEGFQTHVACQGKEALDFLLGKAAKPDVILLDIMMPVMNGYQFREEQLKDPVLASIPTIVLSADRSFHQTPGEQGFTKILKKPVDLEELLDILASI